MTFKPLPPSLGLSHSFVNAPRMKRAFTLVELMVSMTVLVILMLVVSNFVALVQRTWVRANSNVSQFREARIAFDILTRNISQATLNTYYQNEFDTLANDSVGDTVTKAKNYIRQSELQFICGPAAGASGVLGGSASTYPGHAIFFQAPLGVTSLVAASGATVANTESLVNLLCGRGYFVAWGSDEAFRPPFLSALKTVPTRFRLRLMEYSPTSEKNRIYQASLRPITAHSKEWFNDAITNVVTASETTATRSFTRPVAENILALVISPQLETTGSSVDPTSIAPNYFYDSTLVSNPGATSTAAGSQGTRHLMPPMLKVTMVALDGLGGEQLSRDTALQAEVVSMAGSLFKSASSYTKDLIGTTKEPGELISLLRKKKLNYRIFTTTIAMKQSRWSS